MKITPFIVHWRFSQINHLELMEMLKLKMLLMWTLRSLKVHCYLNKAFKRELIPNPFWYWWFI